MYCIKNTYTQNTDLQTIKNLNGWMDDHNKFHSVPFIFLLTYGTYILLLAQLLCTVIYLLILIVEDIISLVDQKK